MKKKKEIIIAVVVLCIIVAVVAIFLRKNNGEIENILQEKIDISKVLDVKELENSEVKIKDGKNEHIAVKYPENQELKVTQDKVMFNDKEGKVIILRTEETNANIYQTTYDLPEGDEAISKVEEYMREFTAMSTSYLKFSSDKAPYDTKQYGENVEGDLVPLEEGIYSKNRTYSITYIGEEENVYSEYDINFYRTDNKLVCELARIFY